jgi:hypothetical protein
MSIAELYDPRAEPLRAQVQAIYEGEFHKDPRQFRNARGLRADRLAPAPTRRAALTKAFQVQTGLSRDRGRGSLRKLVTPKTARQAAERYSDWRRLIQNRQDYEETLGLARSGEQFYRVEAELGAGGRVVYTVWPLPPGRVSPLLFDHPGQALQARDRLNRTQDPRSTGVWWTPPRRGYRKTQAVSHWLPPKGIFHYESRLPQLRPRRP